MANQFDRQQTQEELSSTTASLNGAGFVDRCKNFLPFAALFCSLSTLVCCAFPALFVTLGAGATFVSLLGFFPQLIWFSENKVLVFSVAGALLALNFALRRLVPRECPTDPRLAAQCSRAQRTSSVFFSVSVAVYCVGAFFAFLAPVLW
jgi:hypothetical protein